MNIQYEYTTVSISNCSNIAQTLNRMATAGWDYLNDVHQTSGYGNTTDQVLIFRREK